MDTPKKSRQVITEYCAECGRSYRCIEDSIAQKQGLCNPCYEHLTRNQYPKKV